MLSCQSMVKLLCRAVSPSTGRSWRSWCMRYFRKVATSGLGEVLQVSEEHENQH